MTEDFDAPWTLDDVPPGPYFHGTRVPIEPGAHFDPEAPRLFLPEYDFGVVNNQVGEEDPRRMLWATTDCDAALQWAYQMGYKFTSAHPGEFERLYVWEVELEDPEIDVNMHQTRSQSPVTSLMAPGGRFLRLVIDMPVSDYPDRFLD